MNASALAVIAELYPKYGAELWRHVQWSERGDWSDCKEPADLNPNDTYMYRVKPNTHIVNGVECPAPLMELPEIGTNIYLLDPYTLRSDGIECVTMSVTVGYAKNLVRFGIWLTYEDAKANRDAHYPGVFKEDE